MTDDEQRPTQQAVWIRWIDSVGQESWTGRADAASIHVSEFFHVGFIVFENERQLTLSPTTFVNGNDAVAPFHSPLAIPKQAIIARGEVAFT